VDSADVGVGGKLGAAKPVDFAGVLAGLVGSVFASAAVFSGAATDDGHHHQTLPAAANSKRRISNRDFIGTSLSMRNPRPRQVFHPPMAE
jgi:hypothetical protein